jgi:hypothetical protein
VTKGVSGGEHALAGQGDRRTPLKYDPTHAAAAEIGGIRAFGVRMRRMIRHDVSTSGGWLAAPPLLRAETTPTEVCRVKDHDMSCRGAEPLPVSFTARERELIRHEMGMHFGQKSEPGGRHFPAYLARRSVEKPAEDPGGGSEHDGPWAGRDPAERKRAACLLHRGGVSGASPAAAGPALHGQRTLAHRRRELELASDN